MICAIASSAGPISLSKAQADAAVWHDGKAYVRLIEDTKRIYVIDRDPPPTLVVAAAMARIWRGTERMRGTWTLNSLDESTGRQTTLAVDPDLPHLGGNVMGGDCLTWTPTLWRALLDRFTPRSVLDVGCGEGHAVQWFREQGVWAGGIDGLQRNVASAVTSISEWDITKKPFLLPTMDMVWCCEVVEHIAEEHLENLLDTLANGKVIAMTHALPGQGGYHHVNCQPDEYWIGHLATRGYEALDPKPWREIAEKDATGRELPYFALSGLVFRRAG